MVAPAGSVGALTVLRDQPFEPHAARRVEQAGPDLALLERRHEDALWPPAQQLRQVGLAHEQGQAGEVIAAECEAVEGVELDLVIVPAQLGRVEVRDPIDPEHDGFAVQHELGLPDLQRRLREMKGWLIRSM